MGVWRNYRWQISTAVLAFSAAVAIVGAVVAIAGIRWGDAWPWLLLVGGIFIAFVAVVVQSYAPPGPNLIKRASQVAPEPLLIISGIVTAAIGTAFWFDFGPDDSGDPSSWWVVLIVGGVVLLLAGVLRTLRRVDAETADAALEGFHILVDRARVASEESETAATEAARIGGAHDAVQTARTAADQAQQGHEAAQAKLDDAKDLVKKLRDCLEACEQDALDAETDRDIAVRKLEFLKQQAAEGAGSG